MKKRIIVLGSAVVLVVVLWSIGWFVLAGIIKQNIAAQAQADGVTQPRLVCGTLNVSGFPFRFNAHCQTAQISSGDLLMDIPAVRAGMVVFSPMQILVSAQGPLRLSDSFTGARNAVNWSSLDASIRLSDWRIARASVEGRNLVWSDTLMGETIIAQSPLVDLHLGDMPEQHDPERKLAALAGYAVANSVSYPGITLNNAEAEIQLELIGLPDDVRVWSDPALLPLMQQNGAAIKVVSIHATDADSVLDASGAISLDAQGLPDGVLDIQSVGVAERLGPMLAEPWRMLVFGTPRPDGSFANQLRFTAGNIYSGLVPIATVPSLF